MLLLQKASGLAAATLAVAFAFSTSFATAAQGKTGGKNSKRPAAAATTASPAQTAAPAPKPTPSGPRVAYSSVQIDGPYIAITFDDGPNPANTNRLLDMLAERNIKATFYVVGECVKAFPAVIQRTVREGHEIGNHSWSHPNLGKMSDAAVHKQLKDTHDIVVATTGVAPKSLRPPYGSFSARQQRWAYDQFGYKTILWSVDPFDWKRPGAPVIASRILNQTQPGGIILAHDIHKQTIDAMPATLDGLLAKGYKFVTVSELLVMEKTTPAAPAAPAPSAPESTTPPAAAQH